MALAPMQNQFTQYKVAKELVDRFNKGSLDYLPEKDKEQIAMIAAQMGLNFKPNSKPLRKGLFDLADTALLGLLPNKWRPETIGEEFGFESKSDRLAGNIGTLGGALIPIGLGLKAAKYARGGGKSLMDMGKNKMADLNPLRDSVVNRTSNVVSRAGDMASQAYNTSNAGLNTLLTRALRNAPSPRTSSIADDIFTGSPLGF